jgi:ABC-type branched-subunit amino acid transport system substrate-binding protein
MMSVSTPVRVSGLRAGRVVAALCLAALAAACASAPPPVIVQAPPPPPPVVEPTVIPFRPDRPPEPVDRGVTPPHMQGRPIVRAALLLPRSSSNEAVRREVESMLNAAELALFERGGDQLLLLPRDTGGTRAGGEAAARAALAEGADVILGPLFAQAVTGAAAAAQPRGVPVVAFSTDATVAGGGVYLLSFAPEPAVRRSAGFAAARGARAIAFMGADNALSRRMADVLRDQAARGGLPVYATLLYPPNDFAQATLAIEELAAARAAGAFDALYLNDTPASLRELSSVLRVNMMSAADIFMLGPDSWRSDPAAGGLGVLDGAFMAGPDESESAAFEATYRNAFGDAPSDLASLAYDAVALASQMRGDAGDWDRLENRNGYIGADGLFRLPPDGVAERGLAIYQLSPAGAYLVEPAPARFEPDLAF